MSFRCYLCHTGPHSFRHPEIYDGIYFNHARAHGGGLKRDNYSYASQKSGATEGQDWMQLWVRRRNATTTLVPPLNRSAAREGNSQFISKINPGGLQLDNAQIVTEVVFNDCGLAGKAVGRIQQVCRPGHPDERQQTDLAVRARRASKIENAPPRWRRR